MPPQRAEAFLKTFDQGNQKFYTVLAHICKAHNIFLFLFLFFVAFCHQTTSFL